MTSNGSLGVVWHSAGLFLNSSFFFQNILLGTLSDCQMVCNDDQQTTKFASSRQSVKENINNDKKNLFEPGTNSFYEITISKSCIFI